YLCSSYKQFFDYSESKFKILGQRIEKLREENTPSKNQNSSASSISDYKSIGRNDPCPCGSGKKYKHCHGKKVSTNA
ncbi:MAG: SEC-C metal-binding domain-containing protein, partial [Candidatus Kapaibacteriota bacterium]